MNHNDCAIIVFAKAPVAGAVKTRLIPALGANTASRLHQAMIKNTVVVACESNMASVQLWCHPDATHVFFKELAHMQSISLHEQQGSDLGSRMFDALSAALTQFDRAIIVGTDCPVLDINIVNHTCEILASGIDAVIAPANDGGYVLLGLSKIHARLFADIQWGSDTVYSETVERFYELNYTWKAIDTLWDVDRPEDIRYFKQQLGKLALHPELRDIVTSLP